MRVAVHAGQLLQPVPGGIGRYVRRLLGTLSGAGVEPVAFAAGPAPAGLSDGWVDVGWPRGPWRYELWHRLRRLPLGVPGQVVHAPSLAVPPHGRRPLVVTVHDLVPLRYPRTLTGRGVAFHRRGLALARREAAAVLTPTAAVRAELLDAGFEADRVHVAPHGVDPPGPADEPGERRRLGDLGVRPPYVLFVGTVEPRKGVGDLVTAHARLRRDHHDLQLVVAGPRGWGPAPPLDGAGVVATGAVDDAHVDALYRHAAALAVPSLYEGFGLPVLEGMARACPVVVSDAPALVEVAGDVARRVPAGNADALADALAALVTDEGERQARGAAGRARAARFTWAASADAHAALYRRVAP